MRTWRSFPLLLAGLLAVAHPVQLSAALVGQSISTGIAALKEWNVVAFDNLYSNNHIGGRVFVGGNLNIDNGGGSKGGGNFSILNSNVPSSEYGTPVLTVAGDARFHGNGINAGGGISVGGNVSGSFNNNGQNVVTYGGTNTATANNTTFNSGGASFANTLNSQRADIINSLTGLSNNLKALANSEGVTVGGDSNNQRITVTGSGLNILNWTEALFEGSNNQQLLVTLPDDATLVVNVAGTDIDFSRNFNRFANDNRVLFNFYEATTIDIGRQFSGSILGVFADITGGNSGNIAGSVVGRNVAQNGSGGIQNNYFQGDLSSVGGSIGMAPEPGTWAMLILGFGLIGLTLRHDGRKALASRAA